MPEIKSFPNNQDEYIGAEYVMKWLHGRTSGVFGADSNTAVTAVEGTMSVVVPDCMGWLNNSNGDGIVWWNDYEAVTGSKLQLEFDPADSTLNRIDRVIVEWKTTNYIDRPVKKVLKGTFASTPTPPTLTNNSTVRQISLARVNIEAGTTEITPSMITDERLDPDVCGIVTESVSVDTSGISQQVQAVLSETQAVLTSVENELAELEAGTGVELKKLFFSNTTVSANSFVSDTTYEDFPYRATVELTGAIETMIPEVVLSVADAVSGNYAPVAESYNGGVYLYAADVPETDMEIPTIVLWRGGVSNG